MKPIIELQGVSLAPPIGMDFILQDLSFAIAKSEKVAIVGVSGSGKTSLLRLLNRLVSPAKGTVYFKEKPYSEYAPVALRKQILLIPQEPKLLGMTGKEALIYPLELQQLDKREISTRLTKYCDALQIPQTWLEKNELQLSVGQRQLLSIVRGLMIEPQVLLLDEPTSALDRGKSDRLLAVLDKINEQQQTTIIMVNHQLDISEQFAKRILHLDAGRLIKDVTATRQEWQQIETEIRQTSKTIADEWDD